MSTQNFLTHNRLHRTIHRCKYRWRPAQTCVYKFNSYRCDRLLNELKYRIQASNLLKSVAQKNLHLAIRLSDWIFWFIILHHEKGRVHLTHSHYLTCHHGIFLKANYWIQINYAHADDLIINYVFIPQLYSHRSTFWLKATVYSKLKGLIKKILSAGFFMNVSTKILVRHDQSQVWVYLRYLWSFVNVCLLNGHFKNAVNCFTWRQRSTLLFCMCTAHWFFSLLIDHVFGNYKVVYFLANQDRLS